MRMDRRSRLADIDKRERFDLNPPIIDAGRSQAEWVDDSIAVSPVHGRRQKLTPQDMLPDIGYVKAGLGQIIKRQKEGWSYISG
jgi:hypothetical protein